jgi:hypothetical protein
MLLVITYSHTYLPTYLQDLVFNRIDWQVVKPIVKSAGFHPHLGPQQC